jgi:predicted enzyme related to lactoylglutathione lyase
VLNATIVSKVLNFHLPADNPERAAKFYREVFGWEMTSLGNAHVPYLHARTGTSDDPGIEAAIVKRDLVVKSPVPTIDVDDIDAAMARVSVRGGQQATVRDIEGVGRFGYAIDPEGNVIALLERTR